MKFTGKSILEFIGVDAQGDRIITFSKSEINLFLVFLVACTFAFVRMDPGMQMDRMMISWVQEFKLQTGHHDRTDRYHLSPARNDDMDAQSSVFISLKQMIKTND